MERQPRYQGGSGREPQPGHALHDAELRPEGRVRFRECGPLPLDGGDLGGDGREDRRLQVRHERWTRGVAGRVLAIAQPLRLADQDLTRGHERAQLLRGRGAWTPRCHLVRRAEAGDARREHRSWCAPACQHRLAVPREAEGGADVHRVPGGV